MLRGIARLAGAVVASAVIAVAVVAIGMRTRSPTILRTVRRVNRGFFNPRQMGSAGTPGAYASIVRHVGRRSGTLYETPVQAVPTDDAFLIALPYGTHSDWMKNVVAAGNATIVTEGETHEVGRPELVPMDEVDTAFSPRDQRSHKLFGVEEVLRLHRVD